MATSIVSGAQWRRVPPGKTRLRSLLWTTKNTTGMDDGYVRHFRCCFVLAFVPVPRRLGPPRWGFCVWCCVGRLPRVTPMLAKTRIGCTLGSYRVVPSARKKPEQSWLVNRYERRLFVRREKEENAGAE